MSDSPGALRDEHCLSVQTHWLMGLHLPMVSQLSGIAQTELL